ncbi:MAG: HAD hydrolase family protein [Fusobacteriaceae bacterium]|jgi:3-deoxy-D-manno-octulosonate 8-phosphate phosphatase (KDO 8-P phosphatase)|nr:HAD hydrolase family protein [Fusobacteriaceae bacterium]
MNDLSEKMKKIRLIALDVDGTLTDGRIRLDNTDNDTKAFSAKDGLGLEVWTRYGGISAIITGRTSHVVERRARENSVKYAEQGCRDKSSALRKIMELEKLGWEEVCFVGDDLNDLGALTKAGFSAAPADAVPEVRNRVDFVSSFPGGAGAVREVIVTIMRAQETWERVIADYLGEK